MTIPAAITNINSLCIIASQFSTKRVNHHSPPPIQYLHFSTVPNYSPHCIYNYSHSHSHITFPRKPFSAMIAPQSPVISDLFAFAITAAVAVSFLRLWEFTAKRRLFHQNMNRKLVHISIGLVFMLCWPLFSSGRRGAFCAALVPGVNIIRVLLVGSGLWNDEAFAKSMSRFGDSRELLRGPLYYAIAITWACMIHWRTSPIAIAAICNLCAGDGFADVVGRRLGRHKLPYNKEKSYAGSFAMFFAGFLASITYMHYLSLFGYLGASWKTVVGFFVVSLASAVVESLPISTVLDDNLTVSITSLLLGPLVF